MLYGLIINLIELFSAFLGRNYVTKYREDKATRYFVYFLFFTFFVEVVGFLPRGVYYLDSLPFLKDTFLRKNYWLYNVYNIISYLVYIWYFREQVKSTLFKKCLYVISVFYFFSSLLNLFVSDVYFDSYASYTFIVGTVFVFISVAFYYYEILQSDRILDFHRSISFYISIGALVFHLVVTPSYI